MFKCLKNSDGLLTKTYHVIESIQNQDSLKLDTGIYSYGYLSYAERNSSAVVWSLNNDAITATYYGQTGFGFTRISELNQEFRPAEGLRGFKTNILRGFTPNELASISRIPSSYSFKLGGYQASGSLYSGLDVENIFGGLDIIDSGNVRSMYNSEFGTQRWSINLSYGTYTIIDKVDANADNIIIPPIKSYQLLLSSRKGLKILSTSLNTLNFSYVIQYTSSNTLNILRNPDFTAPDYADSSANYTFLYDFNPDKLRDISSNNVIGNALNIHFLSADTIPIITCQFSICPPFLKFTALDPSCTSIIPFDSSSKANFVIERYLRVDNISNTYRPFSVTDSSLNIRMNNIIFVQNYNNRKSYLDYFLEPTSQINYMNLVNYNLLVELGSGLNSGYSVTNWETVYDGAILNDGFTSSYINITAPDANRKFKIYINQHLHPAFNNFFIYDASFAEQNLQMEIGSSFISGINNDLNTNSTILEFIAGDCTKLKLYAIKSFQEDQSNNTLSVTFVRYSSGESGISNQFLNATNAYGFSMPYISKETKTITTSLYTGIVTKTPKKNFHDILEDLKDTIDNSTFSSWTTESVGNSSAIMNLLPANLTGSSYIVSLFTLTPNVSKALLVLQLEDEHRLEDVFNFSKYRVRYNGDVQTSTISLSPATI